MFLGHTGQELGLGLAIQGVLQREHLGLQRLRHGIGHHRPPHRGPCAADLHGVRQADLAILRRLGRVRNGAEGLRSPLALLGQGVEAELTLVGGPVHQAPGGRTEEIPGREHLLGLLHGLTADWNEGAHRIAVEVGVVAAGDQRVDLHRLARGEDGLEGLDTVLVQDRVPLQQKRTFFDYALERPRGQWVVVLHHLLRLERRHASHAAQLPDDERLVDLHRRLPRDADLVQAELGLRDDGGAHAHVLLALDQL